MHDFEARIAQWRSQLLRTVRDRETVEELEEHLRELLAAQVSAGQTGEDAWTAAVCRLGETDALAREFKKVHGSQWIDSMVYWAILVLLALVLASFVMPMIAGLRDDRSRSLLIVHIACVAIGYTLTIAAGLTGVHYASRGLIANRWNAILCRRLPTTAAALSVLALPLTLLGIVLGAIWAGEHRDSAWSWDAREIGALVVLLMQAAIVAAAHYGLATRMRMAIACAASGLALCAWFSPAVFQSGTYGFGPALALLMAHVVAGLFMIMGILLAIRPRLQRA